MSDSITAFVTKRLESFRDRTLSWGTPETVETLALQLLELESRELYPERYAADPRLAIDLFVRYLQQTDPAGSPTPLHQSVPEADFGRVLFDACSRVRSRLAGERSATTAARRRPEVDLSQSVRKAVTNVRDDARADWLRDPWEWPELHDEKSAAELALGLLRSRAYSEPLLVDVAKSDTASRPGLQLPPVDRVLFEAIVDDVSITSIGSLSPNVFGWRLARAHPELGIYNNNSREWRLHQARRRGLLGDHRYYLHLDVRDFFESVRVESVLQLLPSGHAWALEHMFAHWQNVTPRRGLPQRCLASSVLAHLCLRPIDSALDRDPRIKWCRWMDDITVVSDSHLAVTECLTELEAILRESGLAINVAKTTIGESSRVNEPDLSGVDGTTFPFNTESIDRPRLVEVTDAAVSNPSEVTRSVLSFLARRVRLVGDANLGRQLMALADQVPFAADVLARMGRELGLGAEHADWYIQYARVHPAASDWSVAAWAMLFAGGRHKPDVVDTFFREQLSRVAPSSVLLPVCSAHVADQPGGIEMLRACLMNAESALSTRPLLLALAQARYSGPEMTDVEPAFLQALSVVRGGQRSWEFRRLVQ